MKQFLHTAFFLVLAVILLFLIQPYPALSNSSDHRKYPIICKNELGPPPKGRPAIKVDVNTDGLTDLIVDYLWGSALYINCGDGQYYCAIRSAGRIMVKGFNENGWAKLSVYFDSISASYEEEWDVDRSIWIDGNIYRVNALPLISDNIETYEGGALTTHPSRMIEFDGFSYKLSVPYCQGLSIYAPLYRIEYRNNSEEPSISKEEVTDIYIELPEGKGKIYTCNQPQIAGYNQISSIIFTELNKDNWLDAIVFYWYDDGGSGSPQSYACLLLNSGGDSFVFSGLIELGHGYIEPKFKSRKTKIGETSWTAIVYEYPIDPRYADYDENGEIILPPTQYELYLYQPVLKEFLHITAKPGPGHSTFIPIDPKHYEDILYPPIIQNENIK